VSTSVCAIVSERDLDALPGRGRRLIASQGRRPMEAAYNDNRGVTEAFVRNALSAVNGELDATFDQRRFVYEARWDPEHDWMDIGLRARQAHAVSIQRLELDGAFEEREPLRVEISAKFRRGQFELEAGRAGLRVESWWTDRAGARGCRGASRPPCNHEDSFGTTST
jgi:uncharacterized SAM-dependent methyltransferase